MLVGDWERDILPGLGEKLWEGVGPKEKVFPWGGVDSASGGVRYAKKVEKALCSWWGPTTKREGILRRMLRARAAPSKPAQQ